MPGAERLINPCSAMEWTMTKLTLRFTIPKWASTLALGLGAALCVLGLTGSAQAGTSTAAAAETTTEARQVIHETGQAALNKIEVLWQRIDERRLKNRTVDELVAWAIMGLLVGGLLFRFGRRNQLTSVVLGLVGAFIGGIVANLTQFNLGLGPVLITYEDLLCTFVGGVLILCITRWSTLAKWLKANGK